MIPSIYHTPRKPQFLLFTRMSLITFVVRYNNLAYNVGNFSRRIVLPHPNCS